MFGLSRVGLTQAEPRALVEPDEIAERIRVRDGGGAKQELVIGERRVVADELARRERQEDVQLELVDGLARTPASERDLGGVSVRGGVLGARERAVGQ